MTLSTQVKRGSDCSLTDGVTNRVLTLANTQLTVSGGFLVFNNGLSLTTTTEYTVSHSTANSTITFLNIVWDADYLTIIYVQGSTAPAVAKYCTYTDVYNKTGLSTSEVGSAIVDALILDAEAELEMQAGRVFTNANSITEYLSTKDKDIIGNYASSFQLSHYPVQSITLCNIVDIDGNATSTFDTMTSAEIIAHTYESEDYWLQTMNDPVTNSIIPNGKITLKESTIAKGTNNVKVSYTYGYSSVPQVIWNLAVCLSAIRVWITFMGGQYDRITSYNIPQQGVVKGDIYQRGQQQINMINEEANRLFNRIGKKTLSFFASSGDSR